MLGRRLDCVWAARGLLGDCVQLCGVIGSVGVIGSCFEARSNFAAVWRGYLAAWVMHGVLGERQNTVIPL